MRIFQMQRFTAIALLVFLTLHMIVLHYPPFHIDFDNVVERLENPVWKAIDITFLGVVLVHALTGAYMVITDLERFSRYERVIAWVAILIGMVAFLYGTQTIMAFQAP
jgi:succinate dehydrogenase hydrophobic anchor subunit